jgi:FtsZ-binding cell division protein ZapB
VLVALGVSLTGCGAQPDPTDPASPTTFVGAWRQFLELDGTPVGSARAESTGAVAPLSGDVTSQLNQIVDQLQSLYADANSYTSNFPTAEDGFQNIVTKFQAQIDKAKELKTEVDAESLHRRLAQTATAATEALERQHARVTSVQANYQQRLQPAMARSASLEQTCGKVQSPACAKFLDAYSLMKTKADLVAGGFSHVETVYQEAHKTVEQMVAQVTGTPATHK